MRRYAGPAETVNAVNGVSMTVEPGELVALYGPSGSGKTTLLLMAAALSRPDSGSILFDGCDITTLSVSESALYRRKQVGIVFQSFHLIPGTSALDNAALKLGALGMTVKEAREMVRPWLERLGLGKRLSHPPSKLSMGERQRIAIARALASQPRLLLADEPTGHLDSKRARDVMGVLVEVGSEQNMPILLVTHDPATRAFANKVYTLRDGALVDGLELSGHKAAPLTP